MSLHLSSASAAYLIPKALINTQSLRAEAMSDSYMVHEIGQINSPNTLRHLQLPACSLKVFIADWMEIPVRSHR